MTNIFAGLLVFTACMIPVSIQAQIESEGTIIYGREFIEQFPNVVTVRDLISRIPGAEQIVGEGGSQARGFSRNNDQVLIDGKRLSGKSNDSRSVLSRINVSQVERIEIIRGSSPDIKVSSQESILNIVLREDAGRGSGSWEVEARTIHTGRTKIGGQVSWGGKLGNLEYFASFESSTRHRAPNQLERTFDNTGNLLELLVESERNSPQDHEFAGNFTYTFGNDSVLHLNGTYEDHGATETLMGEAFVPDMGGMLELDRRSLRIEFEDSPEWEVSADFETALGDAWSLRVLGLFSRERNAEDKREAFDLDDGSDDFDKISTSLESESEAIGRASVAWNSGGRHKVEIGSEISVNKLSVDLTLFEREDGGELMEISVPASDSRIKEVRNESFLIHTWKISDRLSLESLLLTEFSRLTQNSVAIVDDMLVDALVDRNFFFVRPSADLRYNPTPRDQIQISVRRIINQFDFSDLTSSVNSDDDIVAGNIDLRPESAWQFEGSFEHRFGKGDGRVKLLVSHSRIENAIEEIEIAPGVDGKGNAGNATSTKLEIDGSWRARKLGIRGLKFEARLTWYDTSVVDPFDGQSRKRSDQQHLRIRGGFRHDVTKWGLSYGANFRYESKVFSFDINDITFRLPRKRLSVFIEKNVFGSISLRAAAENLLNLNFGRERTKFGNGRLEPFTRRETRDRFAKPSFMVSLKGAF